MALIRCPECQGEVSDKAPACPGCGYPFPGTGMTGSGAPLPGMPRRGFPCPFDYKSERTILGMPLVYVVYGPAWAGGLRPAKGFIAVGNIAMGIIAIGGFAFGLFTLAGIGLGLISIAGMAIGIAAGVGGIATGHYAVGGIAVGVYAIGGLGIGIHILANDPHLLAWFKRLFLRSG